MLYLPVTFMVFSCVENRIYINLHPDKQTYFKFESRGDSTDVFDQDFLHPKNIPGWNSLSKMVEKDESVIVVSSFRDANSSKGMN